MVLNSQPSDWASINYSAGRLAEAVQQDALDDARDDLIDTIGAPIYRDWLLQAELAGAIPSLHGVRDQALTSFKWKGRRRRDADPVKTADAYSRLIAAGIMSRTEIIEAEGRDPHTTWAQLAAETEQGLGEPAVVPAVTVQQPNDGPPADE